MNAKCKKRLGKRGVQIPSARNGWRMQSARRESGSSSRSHHHVMGLRYSTGLKSPLPTPQSGQTQSSGSSSNGVPAAMPLSGSPTAGSYSYPHTSQMYFFIVVEFYGLIEIYNCTIRIDSIRLQRYEKILNNANDEREFCKRNSINCTNFSHFAKIPIYSYCKIQKNVVPLQ